MPAVEVSVVLVLLRGNGITMELAVVGVDKGDVFEAFV